MVVTFSNKQRELAAVVTSTIHCEPVEKVEEYNYLGKTFDSLLKFSSNTEEILRKSQQRQYLLRKLSSFGVSQNILKTFYYSFIESITNFAITSWFHPIILKDRNRLQKTVTVYSKIIGSPLRSLLTVYEHLTCRLAGCIVQDPSQALFPTFDFELPSGHRLRCPLLQNSEEESHLCAQIRAAPKL